MTTASVHDGAAPGGALVAQAVGYALNALPIGADADLRRSTPCREWDLGTLLCHVADSTSAVAEGLASGHVRLFRPRRLITGGDTVAGIRTGLAELLRLLPAPPTVTIGCCSLDGSELLLVAAIEVAVHAWDISVACGSPRQISAPLAVPLLELCPALVDSSGRAARFDPPLPVPPTTPAGDRLVAFLGRRP
ncbi:MULTISPECIES: TIGR03086 family metal-binding protein [Nocardioides]|uniref:TIGR03086 family metal-binding protein n=1 Tax=Nocardioides vastitatis TaxID=2568655 RepID=A0ABW0ZD70_9ACTN|nr:TIGR03086 family metal-binding protein [Nocardioides sp.]THJ13141.1 TIGR03086 family protein [Nocardioides sp.]